MILAHFGPRAKRARRCQLSLALLTFVGVVFRSELALLLAHMTLVFVFSMRQSLRDTVIPAGIASAAVSVVITVAVDSFFWQRFPLWPELEAFTFNTIHGKSSEWGVSPWYFYLTNALPRLMMNPLCLLVCVPLALVSRKSRSFSLNLLFPLLAFVAVYSLLPHKEWRFIVYVIPGLTAIASAGASWIWMQRRRSLLYGLAATILALSVMFSAIASLCLLGISSFNYPGGDALVRLQEMLMHEAPPLEIRLDNLSCQTGVTRFLQEPGNAAINKRLQPEWHFDKTEDPNILGSTSFWTQFDFVLAESAHSVPPGSWDKVDVVNSYAGLSLLEGVPIGSFMCQRFLPSSEAYQQLCQQSATLEEQMASRILGERWPRIRTEEQVPIFRALKSSV